jgi:dCMP deaminase
MNKRLNKYYDYYRKVLLATTELSTCTRVQVGAIIVRDGRLLSSGYNGSMPGQSHCSDVFPPERIESMTPEEYSAAHRIYSLHNEGHAELSAISTAAKYGIAVGGCDIAVTHTPCPMCAKSIIIAGIQKVLYLEVYDREPEGLVLLQKCGIKCIQI